MCLRYYLLEVSTIVYLFCLISAARCENNVCPTFKDYYTIKDNPRCEYDFLAEESNVVCNYFHCMLE